MKLKKLIFVEEAPGCDDPLSNFAFKFNLRCYIKGFIEASGGNMCETEEDGQLNLFGDVLLACGDAGVDGSGSVSAVKNCGRGFHSFTFQLNVSAFCGTRGV